MFAAAVKILAELVLFAGAVWRFCFVYNYYGRPTLLPCLTLGATALALVLTVKNEVRRLRQQREENRIGPDL